MLFNFKELPSVRIPFHNYNVTKFQTAELECNITADPAANSVQWYKNELPEFLDVPLRQEGKYNKPTVNNPNLKIFYADDKDNGYYTCTASNVVGTSRSQMTHLDVYGGNCTFDYIVTCSYS